MSLQTPAGLEQSVDNLRAMIAELVGRVERLSSDLAALRAAYNSHSHTLTATASATTTGTDSLGGSITATTSVTVSATAGTPV